MKPLVIFFLSFSLISVSVAQDAEQIMQSVRKVTALQEEQDLHGFIRKENQRTPLSLFLCGEDIQFALDGGN